MVSAIVEVEQSCLHVQQAWHGKGAAEEYEMAHYWDAKFPMNLFGAYNDAYATRSALETEGSASDSTLSAESADNRLEQTQPLRLRRLLMA